MRTTAPIPLTGSRMQDLVQQLDRATQARDWWYRRRPLFLTSPTWLRWDATVEALLRELVPLLVRDAVAAWRQRYPGVQPWLLPREEQLLHHVLELAPPAAQDRVQALAGYASEGTYLLNSARAWHDAEFPVAYPFQPSASPRRKNADLGHELDRTFTARIPTTLLPHIRAWVFDHRATPDFEAALADPSLTDLSTIQEKVVVYRQVNLYHSPDGTPRERSLTRAVSRLQHGDEVGFRHALSSGLNTYHYGTLGPMPPDLNEGFDSLQERCVKLEMAPKRGLYLPHRYTKDDARQLSEDELVLPPNSVWRVAGVRDLVLDQSREGSARYYRQRVIQLVEVVDSSRGVGVPADQ